MPRRLANVLGLAVAAVLFGSLANGVLLRYALHVADGSFKALDDVMEADTPQPDDPAKTGSSASLLEWDELGRMGREFIALGPSAGEIGAFLGRKALEPIRVYAGLNSADTPQARARLALEELKRVGGFERSVLVVVTPTGTGWVDPEAMAPLEYLQGATSPASPSSIPIWRAGCRCWSSPATAARPRARFSTRSTTTGRPCRRTGGRGSTSTASASAP